MLTEIPAAPRVITRVRNFWCILKKYFVPWLIHDYVEPRRKYTKRVSWRLRWQLQRISWVNTIFSIERIHFFIFSPIDTEFLPFTMAFCRSFQRSTGVWGHRFCLRYQLSTMIRSVFSAVDSIVLFLLISFDFHSTFNDDHGAFYFATPLSFQCCHCFWCKSSVFGPNSASVIPANVVGHGQFESTTLSHHFSSFGCHHCTGEACIHCIAIHFEHHSG